MIREATPPPEWFRRAMATAADELETVVDGAVIRARRWGDRGPGIVLVHGAGAHSRWWDHLAPLLAEDHRVVALDLSGHGDSGHRERYDVATWVTEVVTAAGAGGLSDPWFAVGHSMGGWVSLAVAAACPASVAGVVTVDSTLRPRNPELLAQRAPRSMAPVTHRASAEDILDRFRLVPDDPWALPYVVDHVARHSVREVSEGWRWKTDPKIFARPDWMVGSVLAAAPGPVAVFRADDGLVDDETAAEMSHLRGGEPVVTIPASGHHAILDQPLAVAVGVRTVLAGWERGGAAGARR